MHGVLYLIDVIVGGEDVNVPKPSPEVYYLQLTALMNI